MCEDSWVMAIEVGIQ